MSRMDVQPRLESAETKSEMIAPQVGTSVGMGAGFVDMKTMMIIGIVIVIVLIILAIVYVVFFKDKKNDAPPGGAQADPPATPQTPTTPTTTPATTPTTTPMPSENPPPTPEQLAEISARARAGGSTPPPNVKSDEDVAALMEPMVEAAEPAAQ